MTIKVGDKVTYHGSLKEYHWYVFKVTKLWTEDFDWGKIEAAQLQGPKIGIWIKRCRVSNLKKVE